MKFIAIAIGVIILSSVGWIAFSSNKSDKPIQPQVNQQTQISFADIQSDVASGTKLYDVRTKEEFDAGHFENATNLPLQEIESGKYPDVAKDAKIYLYCRSGNRSAQATSLLKDAGYSSVIDLGGLSDVESIGGVLTTN